MTPSKEYPGFSEREVEMFKALGIDKQIKFFVEENDHLILYRVAVEKCFLENMSGPAVESLRRCVIVLASCAVYRLTQEWDDLIELVDKNQIKKGSIWENFLTKNRWEICGQIISGWKIKNIKTGDFGEITTAMLRKKYKKVT